MATTFTWSILEMQTANVDNLQNFVCSATWELTGDDGKNISSTSSIFGYKPEDVTGFTPYNQLTQDQVLGWIKNRLGADGIAHFEGIVQKQLDDMSENTINPEPQPLPWSN